MEGFTELKTNLQLLDHLALCNIGRMVGDIEMEVDLPLFVRTWRLNIGLMAKEKINRVQNA